MILNGYTALAAFLGLLRLILSMCLAGAAIPVWRNRTSLAVSSDEPRLALLVSLAVVIVVLNLVSWPLLYVLLQSYVQQWPAVMCAYGVTQIGRGTTGLGRFLPLLLDILQTLRPALLFVSGTTAAFYFADRRTTSSPLIRRVLALLIATSVLTAFDAVIEITYVAIPRAGIRIPGGCCTAPLEALDRHNQFTPIGLVSEGQRSAVLWGHYALNLGLIAALFALTVKKSVSSDSRATTSFIDGATLLAGVLTLPVGGLFLRDVAAPRILGLPFHQCPYDLISAAPESLAAVAASIIGSLSIGWAFLVSRFANCPQTQEFLPELVTRLRFLALVCYSASLALISVELWIV